MIYTRLAGGLGNQMFQLAAALALRQPEQEEVFLATGGLKRYRVQRAFELEHLLALPAWCRHDAPPQPGRPFAAALLAARVGRYLPLAGVHDRNFSTHLQSAHPQAARRSTRSLWLDGYFQSGWAWSRFEPALAQLLAMLRADGPAPAATNPAATTPAATPTADCVMHVRGSDFLLSDVHRVVDPGYYLRAVAAWRARAPSARQVLVVTDDRAHASALIDTLQREHAPLRFELPEQAHGWQHDYAVLRDARARIIGNSTFSWWAAALDRRQAPTFTPDQWMHGVRRDLYLPWETPLPAGTAHPHPPHPTHKPSA